MVAGPTVAGVFPRASPPAQATAPYRLLYPVAIAQHPLQCDISSRRKVFR